MLAADMALTAGPPIALPLRQRDASVAYHEAGHAVFGLALGWHIRRVTVDGSAHVEWLTGCRPFAECAVVALAGDAAEAWSRRWIITEQDASLLETIARVRGLAAGGCDRCVSVRGLIIEAGGAPDAAVIARFRQLEGFTLATIRRPEIWRAVTALAAALMAKGTLSGNEAEAICQNHFEQGAVIAPAYTGA